MYALVANIRGVSRFWSSNGTRDSPGLLRSWSPRRSQGIMGVSGVLGVPGPGPTFLPYLYLLELFRRRSKVIQKKSKSSWKEHVTGKRYEFWPTKSIFRILWADKSFCLQNYQENCCSRHFTEIIQTQKSYPTYLDKISILTEILLVIPSQNFSSELNSLRAYSMRDISYLSLRL